jgi:SAM-dependent methyltransferase
MKGHRWPVLDGVPIFLLDEVEPTQPGYWATREEVHRDIAPAADATGVDPYVRAVLVGTCGRMYRGWGDEYPIPELPLPPGDGRVLLELGSNWGRWSIAAARRGYLPVGIDPALGAVRAAARVSTQLGVDARYAVADARHLPFRDACFDVVFSFSVLQHLSPADVAEVVEETARVLKPDGVSLHQMANVFGVNNVAQLARRRFHDAQGFDVRYWRPRKLVQAFERIGPTHLAAESFVSLNAQKSDLPFLRMRHRAVVRTSELLRRAAERVPPVRLVADSLWVRSTKQGP